MTVGGVTASFLPLSRSTFGWTAGGGFEVALWSNWSAKLEYLHIRANSLSATAPIPNALGTGIASTPMEFRDNIVRVGLNYRFGPRGGPGVLEGSLSPRENYALNYDFLPDVGTDKAKSVKRPRATPMVTEDGTQQAAQAAPVSNESKPANGTPRYFAEIEDVEDTDTLSTEPKPLKSPSKKRREKEDDESQRMKRIMSICVGC
jgi:hypothetical protein